MPEIDDISARLTALETVVGQLITHLAVRAEDPARWVATRKVLALNALEPDTAPPSADRRRIRDAVSGFFVQAETVAGDYAPPPRH